MSPNSPMLANQDKKKKKNRHFIYFDYACVRVCVPVFIELNVHSF